MDAPEQFASLGAIRALTYREFLRFFRQRNRVIGAVGQPLLFWLLFGTGLQRSFQVAPANSKGPTFLEYYFPGTLILVLLFTAIFATISIIEDRREGFLQSVLVAPITRWAIVLGKVTGGASIAVLQGLIFLLLALTLNINFSLSSFLAIAVFLALTAVSLTSLGFVLAWRMESTQGFHAIMNLLLMPMWLLSGAFFPPPALSSSMGWSQWLMHGLMRLNPLTYSVAGVRRMLYATDPGRLIIDENAFWTPSLTASWTVTLLFTTATLITAWMIARTRTREDVIT
jgi:ABC-2 type transport system permease protein